MGQVVIATTTMYKSAEDHRARVALRTIKQAVQHGHKIVVVDGSPQAVKDMLIATGALVFQDTGKTMGQGRRQAISLASEVALSENQVSWILASAPPEDYFIAWIEPEKDTIVQHLKHMIDHDITIPRRASLSSYPLHQQYAENMGNEAFRIRTGRALDMWFGPRVFRLSAAHYFLDYNGEYGDKWDSIFIPVVRAIAAGVDVGEHMVDFEYPLEQCEAERDSFDIVGKRLVQLNNLIPAIGRECATLDI